MAQDYIPSLLTNSKGIKPDAPSVKNGQILEDRQKIASSASPGITADSPYRISNLMYPNDLMSPSPADKYAGSYVMFYLNVSVDSKLLKEKSNYTVDDKTVGERIRSLNTDAGLSAEQVGGTVAGMGAVTGFLGGAVVGGKGLPGAAGGFVAGGVAVGAVATQTSTFSRAQKRLAAAIALHVPNQLNIRYGASWESENTDTFSMASEGGEAIVKALSKIAGGATATDALAGISGKGSNIAAAVALKALPDNVSNSIQGLAGVAPNPRKEQFFKGVDFRTFTFEYQFFPRNAEEAENVMNIIYMFKLHMHPEFKDSGSFLYVYPSEFDITYFHNNKENLNIHRHTSCVLTELSVNYTPNGQYATFENGMPTQINLQLTFKELGLITKERIQQGL